MVDKFSSVLKRGGIGYNYNVSADVTMVNEQKCILTFTVRATTEENALKEAHDILVNADYIGRVHKLYQPVKNTI